jgi:membrane-associated phospholipid phosphatase
MKPLALHLEWAFRLSLLTLVALVSDGCVARHGPSSNEVLVAEAADAYIAGQQAALVTERHAEEPLETELVAPVLAAKPMAFSPPQLGYSGAATGEDGFGGRVFTLGAFDVIPEAEGSASAPTAGGVPEGYWREDIWHQMGHEALEFGGHGFWRGFKVSYWNLENALVLTAAMGASITIRETGVDDAIRRRTKGQDELSDMSETIQIIGNPATHFGGAGVLWLSSALMKDAREHEVAKSLVDALAVNGMSTILLKVATNTHAPDGEGYAWPSGHTSSSFAAAAVLSEYYGPWVGIPSLALAGLVGYQRIDSRVHDFSDVVFGGFLGYVIGASIAKDNKVELPELFGMKVLPFADPETGASGLALLKRW